MFQKIKYNIIYAFVLFAILIGLDLITNLFYENFYIYSQKFTKDHVILTFFISAGIAFLPKIYKLLTTYLFISFTIIQIGYYSFFRNYLQWYQLNLIFSEFEDIIDSLSSILHIIISLLIVLALLSFLFFKLSSYKAARSQFAVFFITFLLLGTPIYAIFKPYQYIISPLNFSYLNVMYAVSLYTHNLFGENKSEQFKKYSIVKEKSKIKNVILIMGESLTYKQMELYNSNFKNTPNLNTLLSNNNFYYIRGISSGVNTPVAVANFMSNKREATNHRLITDGAFNLLCLANENGYETYWLSKQKEGASIGSVLQFAKHKKIAKHYPENSFDDVLLDDLENIDFTKDNFIILHLRANHSPYEKYTPKEFISGNYKGLDYKEYKVKTYQDSIRYIDNLLVRIFNKVKEKAHQNYSVYFVSDHGEMFAMEYENGKYGHSELFFEVAKIPFLLYTDVKRGKLKPYMSHHQVSKMITKDLGYNLINPMDDNNTYYINNIQSDGGAGSIEYRLSDINESGYTGQRI